MHNIQLFSGTGWKAEVRDFDPTLPTKKVQINIRNANRTEQRK